MEALPWCWHHTISQTSSALVPYQHGKSPLLLIQVPPSAPNTHSYMKYKIEWQDQFGKWQNYQTKNNEADSYRTAQSRAKSTGKRHRIVDGNGNLIDIIN